MATTPVNEIAEKFGISYREAKQLVYEFNNPPFDLADIHKWHEKFRDLGWL